MPRIEAREARVEKDVRIAEDVSIRCRRLALGHGVHIEAGTRIWAYGDVRIGDLSTIGEGSTLRGNDLTIGAEFYGSGRLDVGGGGWRSPLANLTVGDGCVMHDNHLNLNRPVTIGNHVGLSPGVAVVTHGYWNSVLEGYPFREGPVALGDEVIVGRGAQILAGVTVGASTVIGAGAVVTKDLPPGVVAGGVPARVLADHVRRPLSTAEQRRIFDGIVEEYRASLAFRGIRATLRASFPVVEFDGARFDLLAKTAEVPRHTELTDDFRDYVRRKGIWYFGRRFASIPLGDTGMEGGL